MNIIEWAEIMLLKNRGAQMQITIDTKNDSEHELRHVARLLNNILGGIHSPGKLRRRIHNNIKRL